MTSENLQAEWARLLVESLAACGVADVVISPGARSLPLVLAAHGSARLRCHDLIDERVAAFFALGQARASGRPSLLICTSGTAAAHYFPAIVEAASSGTPMLVMTADRPAELHDCGAAQTIDQIEMFGSHVRWFRDVGTPHGMEAALRALRRVASQAVLASIWPSPGPVHLNVPLREPLEPAASRTDEDRALFDTVTDLLAEPPRTCPPRTVPDAAAIEDLAQACRQSPRGLIVCGAAPIATMPACAAIEALSLATRFPILAEAASQMRFVGPRPLAAPRCSAFDLLLRSPGFAGRHPPDLVIQFGAAPLSRALLRYLESHPHCRRWVIAPHGWQDPGSRAQSLLFCGIAETAQALVERVAPREPGGQWERAFTEADRRVWDAVRSDLAATSWSEGHVARALCEALPRGSLLALSSSLPIRHADTFCPGERCDVAVLAQRGANGIDGLVSAAAGAASVRDGPVALLVGDIAFLHDVGGLAAARSVSHPLVLVVIQNGGGRIFEQLPIGEREDLSGPLSRHLVMRDSADLAHAAALYGIAFLRVESSASLGGALAEALARPGCTVIEAVVPPHGAAEQARRLQSAVASAFELHPLVLLHGFTGAPESFADLLARMPPDRITRALALPGHAGEPPAGGFEAAADLLAARIAREIEGRVHLVGYSMGARLALAIALRHPERVARLTLIGAHPGLADADERRARLKDDARWAKRIEEDLDRFVGEWEAQALFATQDSVDPAGLAAQRKTRLRQQPAGLARALIEMGLGEMPDYGPALQRLAMPVDLVVGERDEKFRPIAERMHERLPSARLHLVPGCGHNVVLERPEALAALLG